MRSFAFPSRGQAHRGAPVSGGGPAWLAGAVANQIVQISGTSGAGGAAIDKFSGFVIAGTKVLALATGGHHDSYDNRVVELDLAADAPSWTQRVAPSTFGNVVEDARRYLDGAPSSRHTYDGGFYVPALDKVFYVGMSGAYGNGYSFAATDAYNVTSYSWDAPLTYADIPDGNGTSKTGAVFDGTAIWMNNLRRFNPATNTYTSPITTRSSGIFNGDAPGPMAYDSTRGQIVGIGARTGTLSASRVPVAGSTEYALTFNASAAYTQFLSDKLWYSSMVYDPINDRFLIYGGQTFNASGTLLTDVPGRIFVVTPNAGNVWDMSLLTTTGATPGNTVAGGSGICGRWRYVAALGGVLLLPQASSNLYFLKV